MKGISNSYYEDEVREGFYIPGMIKRSWASQMDILDKIADICRRHDIRWFADCGTLIGAVRHHGFIPWDDDLDICMLKDDYDRFLIFAEAELPEGYKILNLYREREYKNFLTRITNHDKIDTSLNFLEKNHGFPYVSGIDIFPLHYLYNDEEEENERQKKANKIWNMLEKLMAKGAQSVEEVERLVLAVEDISGIKIDRDLPVENSIYRGLDQLYSVKKAEKAEYAALIPFWIKDKSHKFPIRIFEESVEIPFENGKIPVPAGYINLLNIEYGNWERAIRTGGLHNYPYYIEQERRLVLRIEGRLPYLYRFDPEDLRKPEIETNDENLMIFNTMEEAHKILLSISANRLNEQLILLLGKCQELAVKIGDNSEKKFEDEAKNLVKLLEDYCELIYEFSEKALVDVERLDKLFTLIKDEYKRLKEKDFIIILTKLTELKRLKKYINELKRRINKNILIMPVPYYVKNWHGSMTDEVYEYNDIKEYMDLNIEEDIVLLDYRKYDFLGNDPEICMLDPFDDYHEVFNAHPFFYLENLRKYASSTSYIDLIEADIASSNDVRGRKNAERYIISPGIVKSDRVFLPNEKIRDYYLEILENVIENPDMEYWENKLEVLRIPESNDGLDPISKKKGRKTLLFYISISDFYTYRGKALDKVRNVLETFKKNKENLYICWITDSGFEDDMKRICGDLFDDFMKIKDNFLNENIGEYISTDDAEACDNADAFYGSAGFFMNRCAYRSIPVMVWDINI